MNRIEMFSTGARCSREFLKASLRAYMGCASGKGTASGNDGLAKTAEAVAKDGKQPDDASGTVSTYVLSNFCSKFWLIFCKL